MKLTPEAVQTLEKMLAAGEIAEIKLEGKLKKVAIVRIDRKIVLKEE